MPLVDRSESTLTQRLLLLVSLLALGVATTVGATAFASSLTLITDTNQADLEDVPNLVTLEEADAVAATEALGFEPEVVRHQNLDIPVGIVSRQEPVAGARIPMGSTVEIWISAGDEFLPVPEVVGSPLDETNYYLFLIGLATGETTYAEDDAPAGQVLEQSPPVGEVVPIGTAIDLVVSSGPPMVMIPDVRDLFQTEARSVLRDAGFEVTVQDRSSYSVDRGFAMSTDPPAGDELQRGSAIILYVSTGRPPTTTTIAPPPTTTTTSPSTPTTRPTTPTTRPTTTTTTASPTTTTTSDDD